MVVYIYFNIGVFKKSKGDDMRVGLKLSGCSFTYFFIGAGGGGKVGWVKPVRQCWANLTPE